ncbi:hypothetical protein CO180_01405 [candidate division WWE3 bacterium CG_4_9_14_3_um_filter_41_6]|uniref:Ig-like domain-containing protein n=1 Tax=candidate division WWE3 bacterium CG_4_10_14_0_2_um_filter_41_14 TaxID=1975072 RepID=A0A2M7TJS1_UNCKA|nr:MAG: hypothetical protein COY32_02720 [candidate division WWE3 bacterium CG_4_10_14_0_2_um_filter_41_14]PJA39169.1 MAG: hypothetical protein CO180_01405 [candidate division WWE3 bacterium CG_4_9_14_3_um_filter_41_6]
MKNILLFLFCVGILYSFTLQSVTAATHEITHSCSIANSRLDWRIEAATSTDTVKNCILEKFSMPIESLSSATLSIQAHTDTVQKMENKDVSPHTMTSQVIVDVTVQNEARNSTLLTVSIPAAQSTFTATAHDGAVDYSGTSGKTFDPIQASKNTSILYNTATDLAQFVGAGNISLPVSAIATWSCSGSGNAECGVDTYANASLSITYMYTTPDPDLIVNSCNEETITDSSTITIQSANQGEGDVTNPITIRGTLPTCATYQGVDSPLWKCTVSNQNELSCVFNGTVPSQASVPTLTLNVDKTNCSSDSTFPIYVETIGDIISLNNSITCKVANTNIATPTPTIGVTSTPSTPIEKDQKEGDILSDTAQSTNVLGSLAQTGITIILPLLSGVAIVGTTLFLFKRKNKKIG